jgi:hypothetical protein
MKKLLAIALLLAAGTAHAQTIAGQRTVPLGYCQLTSIDASTLLSSCTIPAGSAYAYLVPESQAIRYRDDGVAPTATVGQPLAVGAALFYGGALTKVRVISQVAGAKLNVLFYK